MPLNASTGYFPRHAFVQVLLSSLPCGILLSRSSFSSCLVLLFFIFFQSLSLILNNSPVLFASISRSNCNWHTMASEAASQVTVGALRFVSTDSKDIFVKTLIAYSIVLSLMKQNLKCENRLFNASRSRHCQPSRIHQSVTGLFSATLQTMFRLCLPLVCDSYRFLLVFLGTYQTTDCLLRSQFCGNRWVSSKRIFCATQVVPIKLRQRQKVCEMVVWYLLWANLCRILIILDLEVLKELGEAEKIGEPKPLEVKAEEEEVSQPTTISSNGFYGSKMDGAQAQPNRRAQPMPAPASTSAHATIYPIEAISPYSNKWTMKARCTSKSNIKTWHNKNGEGKLFSVNLLDDSGEIRATGFNEQCDMLYELFQEGSVYYISSPCRVQIAKKQFTNLNNDYELTFERDTVVEKVRSLICSLLPV